MEKFTKEDISVKVVIWDLSRTFLHLVVQMKSNLMGSVIKVKPEFEGACVRFLLSCSIIWM